MKNPWDDEQVTPHDLDRCACRHSRELHGDDRCWACYVITPHSDAPAYPWHMFHLVWPWLAPVRTSLEAVIYKPPAGWDRPTMSPRQ